MEVIISENNKIEIFHHLHERRKLEVIKYNKKIQKLLKIKLDDYRKYCETYSSIEIEIKPLKECETFINIKD